jgi:restriction system protein
MRAAVTNPVAAISANARIARERLRRDLLDRIHAEPPEFFERLIIELLLAMGYGCRRDLARHLGRSGDGGIDGAVPQDVLGLDVVYIQAKRYRPGSSVPVSAVREFAGSLDGRKARKGVFVTTATFPKSAAAFVARCRARSP